MTRSRHFKKQLILGISQLFNNFAKAQVKEDFLLKRDSNTGASL